MLMLYPRSCLSFLACIRTGKAQKLKQEVIRVIIIMGVKQTSTHRRRRLGRYVWSILMARAPSLQPTP